VPGASAVPGALAGLPEAWARVLAKATSSDSQARLATGGAIAEALRTLAAHTGHRSSPARRPATVAFMIATAIAAALIVWFVGVARHPVAVTASPQVQAATAVLAPPPLPLPASPVTPPPAVSDEARPRAKRATVRRATRVAPVADARPDVRSEPAAAASADELVRDVAFGATAKPSPRGGTSDAELADPFSSRRGDPAGGQP